MNINVLITSAGRRVSLVKAFQKELKSVFPKGKVFTTDVLPELSAACAISDGSFRVAKINSELYLEDLIKLCSELNVGILIPTLDTELLILSNNRSKFLETKIIISSPEFISICRDKRETNKFFILNKISIPKEINKENLTYPLFIKPFNGSLSSEIHVIRSKNHLSPYLLTDKKFMFMEYLSKEEYNEYTVDCYYDKQSELQCLVPRKRIEVRGGEISKGKTLKNEVYFFLIEKLKKISGAHGCITIQVFLNIKNKEIVGIEINPRFGGGFPLSYSAGANYPLFLIKEYIQNEKIIFFENWKEDMLMLRYDSEIISYEKNNSI
jgi:carbamoyl-phosphate synthase large subunit